MERALRINILARNHALKRARKANVASRKNEWRTFKQTEERNELYNMQLARAERRTRREDWLAGPLAANRNTGSEKGVFGTIQAGQVMKPTIPVNLREGPKKPGYDAFDDTTVHEKGFTGRTVVGNVVLKDRVVVVRGPEHVKGKIGEVIDVDMEKETVTVKDVNVHDVRAPNAAKIVAIHNNQPVQHYVANEIPLPMSDVRLVVRMRNPSTNDVSDFIVKHVHASAPYIQQAYGSSLPSHTRYISGVTTSDGSPIAIPWPTETVDDPPVFYEGDTARSLVQGDAAKSYRMSLFDNVLGYETTKLETSGTEKRLPAAITKRIQEGIMNELRPKYSKSTTQHTDQEWVQKKILEDARSIWWMERQFVSPKQEKAKTEIEVRQREMEARREVALREGSELLETLEGAQRVAYQRQIGKEALRREA